MKVVVDNKIPYIKEAIEAIADEVIYAVGSEFTPELVKDADALIVRTRTQCNQHLLEGSKVQFIATATIGYDHIDTEYCKAAGIEWINAPGSNAASVGQYIESVFLLLEQERGLKLQKCTIGIIGVGSVGSKVETVARKYGMRVLLNDLPREDAEGKSYFSTLKEIASECNIITFHVPLNKEGSYKTLHLADQAFFDSLTRTPVLINTSRGEVIDTEALLAAIDNRQVSQTVIDVWENEPDINPELLEKCWIGTPHIAGYSADGKANATRMALKALCAHFDKPFEYKINPPAPEETVIKATTEAEALLHIYDPRQDSERLKTEPQLFEYFRGNYPLRREKKAYEIEIE
ncbi:4-phosphoerythronate dehydrogenase PdxB [Bacteroides sp. 224]|uniref:4-phosphoerythronate dehydrogenase PdxB n=1 Tax=Bacteroides sp. 224 TaxID=2302936 RepID=UPI0013D85A62|nr:4-phosphoerythronate dehydrogenase PdxB [Bacteroides sp. 224]NDV65503.1 4-phosphoerythronate dehydrogenase PdxB [Bacteroides sp. 224]